MYGCEYERGYVFVYIRALRIWVQVVRYMYLQMDRKVQ